MTRIRTIFALLAVSALLAVGIGVAQPAAALNSLYVDQIQYISGVPQGTWYNITYNTTGDPAKNCWMQAKLGVLYGYAFVQHRYIAGTCSGNTGIAMQWNGATGAHFDPVNFYLTTGYGSGPFCSAAQPTSTCTQISDGSVLMLESGHPLSYVQQGYFSVCQSIGNIDHCKVYDLIP